MKAAAMSLSFLGNEGRILIPFFQRGYVWNTSNWSELLEELLDFEKSHFLGSLILKQQERRSGMPKEVVVIDGQQRLTTLSILLRALYDGFDTETQRHSAASLGYALFYKRNQTDKNAALLLFWIELYRRNKDNRQSVKELKYNYSLEHIMPQKWEEYWGNVPVVDSNGNPIVDADTAKAKRNAMIFQLGNMTLLNSRLNTSIRNYDFDLKISGVNRKRGIRAYSDLGITRFDILAPYEAGDTVWNEQKIAARTAALAADVVSIW